MLTLYICHPLAEQRQKHDKRAASTSDGSTHAPSRSDGRRPRRHIHFRTKNDVSATELCAIINYSTDI